jgi:RNA polymerase sigma factor (sigma-70 family)
MQPAPTAITDEALLLWYYDCEERIRDLLEGVPGTPRTTECGEAPHRILIPAHELLSVARDYFAGGYIPEKHGDIWRIIEILAWDAAQRIRAGKDSAREAAAGETRSEDVSEFTSRLLLAALQTRHADWLIRAVSAGASDAVQAEALAERVWSRVRKSRKAGKERFFETKRWTARAYLEKLAGDVLDGEDLLRYYGKADSAAFDRLVTRNTPRLRVSLSGQLANAGFPLGLLREFVKDSIQETWLRVLRTLPDAPAASRAGSPYDPELGAFSSWLNTIARNLWKEQAQGRARYAAFLLKVLDARERPQPAPHGDSGSAMLEPVATDLNPAERAEKTAWKSDLERCVRSLRKLRDRAVFDLSLQAWTLTAIGALLGLPTSTAHSSLKKVQSDLRRRMQAKGYDASDFHRPDALDESTPNEVAAPQVRNRRNLEQRAAQQFVESLPVDDRALIDLSTRGWTLTELSRLLGPTIPQLEATGRRIQEDFKNLLRRPSEELKAFLKTTEDDDNVTG